MQIPGFLAHTDFDSDPFQKTERLKRRAQAFLIGLIALSLALGVAFLDNWYPPSCARSSISHYVYEPLAGTAFVMALSFVGAFMIAYSGETRLDAWVATAGGIGGLVLAFFPTAGLGCAEGALIDLRPLVTALVPADLAAGADPLGEVVAITGQDGAIGNATTQRYHFVGAGVMFLVLLYFCLYAFTRINDLRDLEERPGGGQRPRGSKRGRNLIYYACAALIVLGMVMITWSDAGFSRGISAAMARAIAALPLSDDAFADTIRPVYHGELLALMAFGASWMIKGRFLSAPWAFLSQSLRSRPI